MKSIRIDMEIDGWQKRVEGESCANSLQMGQWEEDCNDENYFYGILLKSS